MKIIGLALAACALHGCATLPPPTWSVNSDTAESEYSRFRQPGTATITGQAFLSQQGGGVVKAAGRTVTLDPATAIGREWWQKAGKLWVHRALTPPSPGFHAARRTTTADADGRFKFTDLPAGTYFVRTEVTWVIGGYHPVQGGLVGSDVSVSDGQTREIILNHYPR